MQDFSQERGAPLRNDSNFVSFVCLFLCSFLWGLLLILESRQSSHRGDAAPHAPPLDKPLYVIHQHGGLYWENLYQSLGYRPRLNTRCCIQQGLTQAIEKQFYLLISRGGEKLLTKTGKVNLLHLQSQFPLLHPPSVGSKICSCFCQNLFLWTISSTRLLL